MVGTLARYIHRDDDGRAVETAHHEAAHALRAHGFGVTIKQICVNSRFGGWNSHVGLSGNPNDHPSSTHAQISLAGPVTSLRYLRQHPDIVFGQNNFGDFEDEADLLHTIGEIRWVCGDEKKIGTWLKFTDLTADNFPECELADVAFGGFGIDDIERTFDVLIIAHYNRYYRIPRISTLLRRYREQEQIAHQWVEENWSRICLLASHILQQDNPNTRYTHRLPGKKFYSWIRKHETPQSRPAAAG